MCVCVCVCVCVCALARARERALTNIQVKLASLVVKKRHGSGLVVLLVVRNDTGLAGGQEQHGSNGSGS